MGIKFEERNIGYVKMFTRIFIFIFYMIIFSQFKNNHMIIRQSIYYYYLIYNTYLYILIENILYSNYNI